LKRKLFNKVARLIGVAPRIGSGLGEGLRFDAGEALSSCITGEYEQPVQEAVSSMLHAGGVFFDIGANVGFFSMLAARMVGEAGAVYAFEPVPANAAKIERNASLNGFSHVHVLPVAISDEVGSRELLLAEHVGGSVLRSAGTPPDLVGSMQAETTTIDTIVQRASVRMPDVVKIDVEGAELQVLKGMRRVLEEKRPRLIIEFDDAVREECEAKLGACRSFLESREYECAVLPSSYANQEWFVQHLTAFPLNAASLPLKRL
jgi:FkbM family methyltransferase